MSDICFIAFDPMEHLDDICEHLSNKSFLVVVDEENQAGIIKTKIQSKNLVCIVSKECHLETFLLFRSASSAGDDIPIYCNDHENFHWVTKIKDALQDKLSDIWLICDKDPNSGKYRWHD